MCHCMISNQHIKLPFSCCYYFFWLLLYTDVFKYQTLFFNFKVTLYFSTSKFNKRIVFKTTCDWYLFPWAAVFQLTSLALYCITEINTIPIVKLIILHFLCALSNYSVCSCKMSTAIQFETGERVFSIEPYLATSTAIEFETGERVLVWSPIQLHQQKEGK